MPRTVPTGLLTSPTRCWAVLIERADSESFGLTDSTVPFVYNGVTYQTFQGADASAIHQEAGTPVDDFEIRTILNDALAYVTSEDVYGTRYEGSFWTLFEIDYLNPANGGMIWGTYRLARAKTSDTGMSFQLLGLLSFLKQATGRTYSANCDVMKFGDKRCDPSQTIRAARTLSLTVGSVQSLFTIDFFSTTNPSGYYNFGDATFTSGQNNGLEGQIKKHVLITPAAYAGGTTYNAGDYSTSGGSTWISLQGGNTGYNPATSPLWWAAVTGNPAGVARITWRTPPPYPVAVGDQANLCFGCDRRKATCQTVTNASNPSGKNIENFHGWYLPSPDVLQVVGRANVS